MRFQNAFEVQFCQLTAYYYRVVIMLYLKFASIFLTLWTLSLVQCIEFQNYIDLGYSISEETIFYPGQRDFELTKDYTPSNSNTSDAYSFCMGEHGGTHLDAPFHFWKSGWTVEQIPQRHLVDVPGVVIDIEERVKETKNWNYALTVTDLINHEMNRGEIPANGLVMVYTGNSKNWPDKARYLGWNNSTGKTKLNSPGISIEAAKWLYNERHIVGIGLDTASVDVGSSETFPVHHFLAAKQVYNLENVGNLHLLLRNPRNFNYLPPCKFFVLPLKIVGGTGAPARILANCPHLNNVFELN